MSAPVHAPAASPAHAEVESYASRLRKEGAALAACGVVGSVVLVLLDARTTDHAGSTLGQLAVVVLVLATLGVRSVRRALAASRPDGDPVLATGEPTPLWQMPLIVVALATPFVLAGSWDAGLRVTLGCTLVGLAQAVVFRAVVVADERRTGRRYARAPGSRILRGTRLTHRERRAPSVAPSSQVRDIRA